MNARSTAFRALHASGCFVLPNPWDAGSARLLADLGFKALASTSAGMAFSMGKPDLPSALSLEDVLLHLKALVNATSLPVNADFQNGYAADADGVAANVTRCLATGVAGLSIEDAPWDGSTPLFPLDVALARLRAARQAIDASGTGALLTARCEAWLVGVADAAGLHPQPDLTRQRIRGPPLDQPERRGVNGIDRLLPLRNLLVR